VSREGGNRPYGERGPSVEGGRPSVKREQTVGERRLSRDVQGRRPCIEGGRQPFIKGERRPCVEEGRRPFVEREETVR
jgi:hypothetical protein